jgi:hypothetical protein
MARHGRTARTPIDVVVEATDRKAFAIAIDWPGWARAGRTPELALDTLAATVERYRPIAAAARATFPDGEPAFRVVSTVEGNASTTFGVPAIVLDVDRRSLDRAGAAGLASVVEAAWTAFDRVAAAAPAELRKGPRGGGRVRDAIIAHVNDADDAYAHQIGIRVRVAGGGGMLVGARRAAMLEVLRRPSDGAPISSRWTPRYAARRIAWHALDHAWEIEDRTEPG